MVASATVLVLASVAVITELPDDTTALNVATFAPLLVITLGVPEVYVADVFAVPPVPLIDTSAVIVLSYSNVGFVPEGVVKLYSLVYFSTVTVISFVPSL